MMITRPLLVDICFSRAAIRTEVLSQSYNRYNNAPL